MTGITAASPSGDPIVRFLTGLGVHYAWVVAFVTFFAALVAAGAVGSVGVMLLPLQMEFGWTQAEISSALAIRLALLGLVYAAWQWFRVARWVRAWGYAERESDLYLTHGLWFKELTVVPYGRMQAVKVESGPLARSLGLANIELVTASLQSSARIPGLPKADAEQLRDRLTAIGIGQLDAL